MELRLWSSCLRGHASHLGPSHHSSPFASFITSMPRLNQSAGLSFLGSLQDSGSTNCWISSSRFRKNAFQRLAADLTQARATSLSL
ncbi:hypothetical protein T4A_1909 [Trichinella pseudospiralis]|uniref:Uncharacterized protein n=1 Tax=Trichinella pseudospiralis TaxID=6337 RepID=A0A0V1DUF6_TRIPS|nr:hypothetical protein T4A_1909 [Trichinella pseudospiralis]